MKYVHDNSEDSESEFDRLDRTLPSGLKIKKGFRDDAAESKTFIGEVNALTAPAEPCTVQIRVGYDLESPLYLHEYKSIAEEQVAFDRDSMLYTVSSLEEFRAAVIDGAIVAEQKRIAYGNAVVVKESPRTRKTWNWIRSFGVDYPDVGQWNHDHGKQPARRPGLHIFLSTPQAGRRDDRMFILGDMVLDRTPWHWGGFEINKINWDRLYSQLLKTERHRKNITALCDAISESI